jgi:NitT/TauT family transport system permease protein
LILRNDPKLIQIEKAIRNVTNNLLMNSGDTVMSPRKRLYKRYDWIILGSIAVLLAIGLWEAVWDFGWISPLFFSGPSAVAKQFGETLRHGTLLSDMEFSGRNFAVGFLLASFAGIVLGIVLGWYRTIRLLSNPFVSVFYSMPRIAIVPLVIMWCGIGIWSKIFIVFLFSFFPILVNTVAGVRATDGDLLRIARAYCATDWQIFITIVLPSSVPFILAGIRQGLSLGLIGVVISEMSGGSEGVGFMVVYGGQTFQTDTLFLGVVIIALAGILLTWLSEWLERRFSRWRPAPKDS